MRMRPYKKVARILLIFSAIKYALAAPVPVQQIHEIRVHVLDKAGDRTTASQAQPDLPMNGTGWANGPGLGSYISGHQREHDTRSKDWETPSNPEPEPEPQTPIPGPAGDDSDSHSFTLWPSSAQGVEIDSNASPSLTNQGSTDESHSLNPSSTPGNIDLNSQHPTPNSGPIDVRPQAHPDPLALLSKQDYINSFFESSPSQSSESAPGSPHDTPPQMDQFALSSAHDYINSLFYSSPSSESTSGFAHDTPSQAHPDPVAGSPAQSPIDLVPFSSTSSEATPGSPLDTHLQAHSDPVIGSSAQNPIDLAPSSSTSSEATPGSPLDTHLQAHSVIGSSAQDLIDIVSSPSTSLQPTPGSPPLTPSSAHGIANSYLPPPSPGPADTHLWPVPSSGPWPSIRLHPLSSAESPNMDFATAELEKLMNSPFLSPDEYHLLSLEPTDNHLPAALPPDPGLSTGPHPLLGAESPNEDFAMEDLDTLMNIPFLSTDEYRPLSLGPTDNHLPPALPPDPGLSSGPHPLLSAESPNEDFSMADLERLMNSPSPSTKEYHSLSLGPTDNHLPPALPPNPGLSTGSHPLLDAESPNEDFAMADLERLMNSPSSLTDEHRPGPTDNHLPPALPPDPGLSTGPHPLLNAESSNEDFSMADLERLMNSPSSSTDEYRPLNLGPTDSHLLPALPPDPGLSTGPYPLLSAESPNEDFSMADLERLMNSPSSSADEYRPLSLGPTDNHLPPAKPPNPGLSTGLHPPPGAPPLDEDTEMVDLEHPPPVGPSNSGPSTGLHTLPSAQSPDEDSETVDLDTLLKTPFLSTDENYIPSRPSPVPPSSPGPSTGLHPPPVAEPPHGDSAKFSIDLEKLLKSSFLRPRLSGSGA